MDIQKQKKISCVYRLILILDGQGRVKVERGKATLGDFSIFDEEIICKVTKVMSDNLRTQLQMMGLPLKSTVTKEN